MRSQACSLLGENGGNCNDISGSGSSGTYGRMAFCDPGSKLSFVMTQFYEATNRNPASCDFAGNATVNTNAPSSVDAENSAVSSCLANSAATFTPTAPSTSGGSSGGGSSTGGGSSSSGDSSDSNGALSHTSFLGDLKGGVFGTGLLLTMMVATGFWTLA